MVGLPLAEVAYKQGLEPPKVRGTWKWQFSDVGHTQVAVWQMPKTSLAVTIQTVCMGFKTIQAISVSYIQAKPALARLSPAKSVDGSHLGVDPPKT